MSNKVRLYLIYILSTLLISASIPHAFAYDAMSKQAFLSSECAQVQNSSCGQVVITASDVGPISQTLITHYPFLDGGTVGTNGSSARGYTLIDTVNFDSTMNEGKFVKCTGSYDNCLKGVSGSFTYTSDITQATTHKKRKDQNGSACPVIKCDIQDGSISGNFYPFDGSSPYNFNLTSSDINKDINIGAGVTLRLVQMVGSNCLTMLVPAGYNYIACKSNIATVPPPEKKSNDFCFGSTACTSGANHSLFMLSIFGKMVECVKDTIEYLFNGAPSKCPNQKKAKSLLADLQNNLRPAVTVALILYTIFFGINIALGDKLVSKGEFFGFIIKIVAVLYFSVGIKDSNGKYQNGVDQYVFGGFYAVMNSFSNFIMSGSSGELCNFVKVMKDGNNPYIDPKTGENYSSLSLWDGLDCTLAYTTGLASVAKSYNDLKAKWDGTRVNGIDTFFSLLGETSLLYLGILTVVTFEFVFVIFIGIYIAFLVSIAFYFVKLFIMAMVALALMSYLAVIFVPFALFSHTKPYFDKWLSIMLSFSLQPVVAIAFLSLLLGIFNDMIFTDCHWDTKIATSSVSSEKFYFWTMSDDQPKNCKKAFGYVLYHSTSNRINTFDALFLEFSVINPYALYSLFPSLLKSIVFIFFFYFFAKQLGQFSAQITSGAAIPAGSATEVFDKAVKFAKDSVTKGPGAAAAEQAQDAASGESTSGDSGGGAPRGGA